MGMEGKGGEGRQVGTGPPIGYKAAAVTVYYRIPSIPNNLYQEEVDRTNCDYEAYNRDWL